MQNSMHTVDGKKVECKYATPKENKKKKKKVKKTGKKAFSEEEFPQVREGRKLFVGGLPKTAKEDDLLEYFSQFGPLEDYVVMVDRDTQKPRGFGFVTFKDAKTIEKVLSESQSH